MKNIKNNIPQGLLSVAGAIALATLSAPMMAGSASAATVSFQVGTAATGSVDVDYDVKISDIAGGVQIDVNQAATSPNSADILGLFFNLQPGNASNFGITSASQFTKLAGDAITQVCFNTTSCGGGNNVNGMGLSFDIGMNLGSQGSSGGLVKFSSFTIASASLTTANFLGQAFAVRAQSAGSNPATGGSGSVKELGFAPSTVDTITPPPPGGGGGTGAVPEPLTMLGAGAAVAFGSYFKKRANKNSNKA